MTLRLLHECLEKIHVRQHNDFALNARVHGHNVDLITKVRDEVVRYSEDQIKDIKKTENSIVKRMVEERAQKRKE